MFGYVKPLISELKVGEYQYYKATYCGICNSLGSECGCTSRLFLTYDSVFLALFLSAVCGEKNEYGTMRCPVNPLAKRKIIKGSDFTDYAAASCGILSAFRFADNKQDEKGARVAAASLGCMVSKGWLKRTSAKYPGLCEGIKERLDTFNETEKKMAAPDCEFVSVDELANRFGDVLSFIFAYPFTQSESDESRQNRVIGEAIGKHIGRWIYCIDALDDLKEDEKRHRFNPFLTAYGSSEILDEDKTSIKLQLDSIAGEAIVAFDLCDNFEDYSHEPKNIINNILSQGLTDVADLVLRGEYKKRFKDTL